MIFFMFIFSVSAWVCDILLTLTYSSDHRASVHPAVADLTTLLLDLATSSLLSFFSFKKDT